MGKLKKDELSPEAITEQLRNHLIEQKPVKLYNTYQGVPISFQADVAMIHPDYVGLIIHPYQAVCIKEERRTYIESKSIPALIRAYPMSIDYTNQVVMLKKLVIPHSISVDLHHSWVAPEKKIKVEISSEDKKDFVAEMMQIAVLDQNRVRVVLSVPPDVGYKRFDEVDLAFRLASNGDLIQVSGTIHSLAKIRNQNLKRMEIDGKAPMADEISILAYIAKREDQIISHLDKVYQKLRKGKNR
jgi:hypothetical protein